LESKLHSACLTDPLLPPVHCTDLHRSQGRPLHGKSGLDTIRWRYPCSIRLCVRLHYTHTHTHTKPFNGLLSGTTRVGRYQKKHSPTHTHPDHRTSFIIFLHLQRSMASSLFRLHYSAIQKQKKNTPMTALSHSIIRLILDAN